MDDFNAKSSRDVRTYLDVLSTLDLTQEHRQVRETRLELQSAESLNRLLSCSNGTANFHSFTSRWASRAQSRPFHPGLLREEPFMHQGHVVRLEEGEWADLQDAPVAEDSGPGGGFLERNWDEARVDVLRVPGLAWCWCKEPTCFCGDRCINCQSEREESRQHSVKQENSRAQ